MIDRDHRLPVKRQAQLLGISRGSVYYQPLPIPEGELMLSRGLATQRLSPPRARTIDASVISALPFAL